MTSKQPRQTAVVLAGHGSKTRGFDAAMEQVAAALRRQRIFSEVCCAFLEAAKPSISEAIDRCVDHGAQEVRVLPYFVLSGTHVCCDIPQIVDEASGRHAKKAEIILCPYLGYHPKLVSIVQERILEGMGR